MKINKAWHEAHKMPDNPTLEQRIAWHLEHTKNCDCRKPSPKLQAQIDEFVKRNQ